MAKIITDNVAYARVVCAMGKHSGFTHPSSSLTPHQASAQMQQPRHLKKFFQKT